MRALVIDDAARQAATRVVEYSAQHWFVPGTAKPPGDNPQHVCHLNTYRCVFSYTASDGVLWRHLSISVPSKDYPNPAAAFEIAGLFGFTGYDGHTIDRLPEGWVMKIHKGEHCVVLGQQVPPGLDR